MRFIGRPSAWKASVAELPAFFAQGSSSVDTSQTEAIEDWVYLLHHTRGYAFISWPQRQVSVLIAEPQNIRQSNHYEGLLPAMELLKISLRWAIVFLQSPMRSWKDSTCPIPCFGGFAIYFFQISIHTLVRTSRFQILIEALGLHGSRRNLEGLGVGEQHPA